MPQIGYSWVNPQVCMESLYKKTGCFLNPCLPQKKKKKRKNKTKQKKLAEATAGKVWFGKMSLYFIILEGYGKPPGFLELQVLRLHLKVGSLCIQKTERGAKKPFGRVAHKEVGLRRD